MNVYDNCKTREQRRLIDKQLVERAASRMLWQTSYIVPGSTLPNGVYVPPQVRSTNKGTYRKERHGSL